MGDMGNRQLVWGWVRKHLWMIAWAAMVPVLVWTGPVHAAATMPGDSSDPVVTRSFVESYFDERCRDLEEEIEALWRRIADLERQIEALAGKRPVTPPSSETQPGKNGLKIVLTVGQTSATINGRTTSLEQPPYSVGDTVMVPLRFIGQAMGAGFTWDNRNKKIVYHLGDTSLVMQVGQTNILVNGEQHQLKVAPQLAGGTTMVPLRVVAEYLGAKVDYSNKKITITQ